MIPKYDLKTKVQSLFQGSQKNSNVLKLDHTEIASKLK